MKFFGVVLVLSFVALSSCASVKDVVKVEIFSKESELFAKYPDAKSFETSEADEPINLFTKQYVLGQRLAGDRLAARGSDSRYWATPQDITLNLNYPTSGVGAIVTYVQIIVNQDNSNGQAYVTSGGLGQRFIGIAILASSTRNFSYNEDIYGL